MNISYRWLRALLPELETSPEDTAELLALRGAPVEDLVDLAPGLAGLVVARVEEVRSHPEAERLRVCRVDAGGDAVEVVCGAPNVRVGALYPFAPPGSSLPNGVAIREVAIRGVASHGMLCSEAELELGPDASGIMELAGSFQPGQPLAEALGLRDWRMDVEITPNRGDLLSHVGVARELASRGTEGVWLPPIPGSSGPPWRGAEGASGGIPLTTGAQEASSRGVRVRVEDPDLCSRYLGAVVRGVKVGPSPAWLAARLRGAGARPINNVVDATNYVLLELGQPLHAFDLGKLGGAAIVVRRARDGELIRTLDGEDRRLEAGMLAICDVSDPVAIAGVMGGADSEVSETTNDILLECALFHPKSIRGTREALDMSTDASYRFERGVDPAGMELAVRRAVEIILATAGGEPDPEVLDACPVPWEGLTVPLRPSRVQKVLGIGLSPGEIRELLDPLGFRVRSHEGEAMQVAVPGFRSYDVLREVDLIEEVARTYGYDRFPSELGPFRPGTVPDHPLFQLEDELRELLVGEGFLEAQTMAFAPEGEGEVEVSNPVSAQESFLRARLLPGLVRRTEYNFARGLRNVRLFELGTVFSAGEGEGRPREDPRLGLVVTGDRAPSHWKGETPGVDLWYVKGLLERLVRGARLGEATITEGGPTGESYVQEEAFTVRGGGGEVLGGAGRIDPRHVDAPAWAAPVWALELLLPSDPRPKPPPRVQPPPPFPGVDRDLALLVPGDLPARQVQAIIRDAAGPLLVDLRVFDLYEGRGIPKDFRSIGFRLRYQSGERTLTDDDVDRSVRDVTARLREELGVEPRG
jgi:phenylalanyl-tRNA synthetase beta chain